MKLWRQVIDTAVNISRVMRHALTSQYIDLSGANLEYFKFKVIQRFSS